MQVEYYYELTGNRGKTLFGSLRESDYNKLVADQAENYINEAVPGAEWRDRFIDEHLWPKLSGDDLDSITDKIPELKGKDNSEIRKWLYENKCPIIDEEDDINDWGWNRANMDAQDGILWDHIDQDNDVDTALGLGLIKYPKSHNGKYIDDGNADTTIPAEIANKIHALCDKSNKEEPPAGSPEYKGPSETSKEMERLEKEAVEKLILVSGFYCDIHGGRSDYENPIPKSEVLTCPSCGHPICPICANMCTNDPDTEEKAREYLESCDSVSGMAYCGQCGDYSERFMLDFLKLVKCPIPEEYLVLGDVLPPPRIARYVATATVSALPDFPDIAAAVKEKFDSGISGIIEIDHSTGEIWGYPERHPDYWLVTILYPHER